jgi:hypothetical protein
MDKTMLSKRGHYDDLMISMATPKLQQAINNCLNYYEMVQNNLMRIKQKQHQFKHVKNGLKGKEYIIIKMSMTG